MYKSSPFLTHGTNCDIHPGAPFPHRDPRARAGKIFWNPTSADAQSEGGCNISSELCKIIKLNIFSERWPICLINFRMCAKVRSDYKAHKSLPERRALSFQSLDFPSWILCVAPALAASVLPSVHRALSLGGFGYGFLSAVSSDRKEH